MLTKIIKARRLLAPRNIVYFFSKDPFEKFNKKKEPRQDKTDEESKNKPAEKNKVEKGTGKVEEKYRRVIEKHAEKMEKQETGTPVGFEKFGGRRHSAKNASNKDKEPEPEKQANNTQPSEKEEHKSSKSQEQESDPKREAQSYFSEENQDANLKGFEKFNRRRASPNKQTRNKPKQEQKTQGKKADSKRIEIPTVNIDLKSDPNQPETTVLRKSKGLLHKKREEEKPAQQINQASKQPEQPKPQPSPQMSPQQSKWQEFQRQKERLKQAHKHSMPRYERLNLTQQPQDKQKKAKEPPNEPVNLKKSFTNLIIAGIGLFLLSNNEYFKFSLGRQEDPQYLKKALEEDRIEETWIHNIEVDLHNEQSVKGKNYKNFIYIREKNGDIVYCISNEEYQTLWLAEVDRKNKELVKRNDQQFPMGAAHDALSRAVQPKTIIVSPRHEDKKSSLVGDTRSILSMVLLYFFIKSLVDVGKGAKGKGGKGATGLFENQKSHRFREALKITFQDVVGMQKAKDEIVQFIDFLKFPEKYNKLGARIPKGALLTGPPGTGKTMIAKACAGQSKVPFFTISGSEFIEMYVGVGAQRVRNLFKEAKQSAPSIIFIDEIDAVGKKRSGMGGGGNDQRDTTLNQLLVEMDGFDTDTNVIVFAATNQKEVLDPALTRPGRFDRLIEIDLPDLQGRRQIFQVHLKPLVLDRNIQIKQYAKRLATLTPGFSGADIKNVCNEAAIIAARNNKEYVSIMDFELATQRIIGGVQKKSQLITPETRKIVAYHECGHGVVSWFIQNANPLLKLTIIPRSKGALGFAQYLPNEHQMYTKVKLLDEICVILGGRIAEQIFFGRISTGASDDLNKAYQIAKAYVTEFGFGDKLGWIGYSQTEYAKEYSKEIENSIDSEILQIMKICSERTRSIINEKKDLIHNLAEKLLEVQTIDQTIIESILGLRPFKLSKQHSQYIKEKKRMTQQILGVPPSAPAQPVKSKRMDYIL